jgi:hypothetical protein
VAHLFGARHQSVISTPALGDQGNFELWEGLMRMSKRVVPTLPISLAFGCLIIAQLFASPLTRPLRHAAQNHAPGPLSNDAGTTLRDHQQNNSFQDLTATMQRLRDEYARIVAKFNALKFE